MAHFYSVLDVFTEEVLGGNPLAVVFGADDIEDARMQRIAREFNLSETVFVLGPADRAHSARLRIFTPGSELPFAGHPTVGTAVALGLQSEHAVLTLEEGVGLVTCTVSRDGHHKGYARFALPLLPERLDVTVDTEKLAAALRLAPADIAVDGQTPAAWSAGVPFLVVPVKDRAALERAAPDAALWPEVFPQADIPLDAYLYTSETVDPARSYATRMFGPTVGIPEDPATGSAAAVFPAHLLASGAIGNGSHELVLEQGFKMGRPSVIDVKAVVREGRIASIEIGGHAVLVASGTVNV